MNRLVTFSVSKTRITIQKQSSTEQQQPFHFAVTFIVLCGTGCCPGGAVLSGGGVGAVHDRTGSDITTPPPEQNESQTPVKILPCPKLRLQAVKIRTTSVMELNCPVLR